MAHHLSDSDDESITRSLRSQFYLLVPQAVRPGRMMTEKKKPRNLRVLETTPISVEVQWEKPQEEIDRYILSVSPSYTDGPGLRRQINVSSGEDSAVINDLEPGSVYNISLVAEKGSEWSQPVTVEAATRSFGPRNLRVVETTPTFIKIQWEKPLGMIFRYILLVSPSQTDGPVLRRKIEVSSGEDSAVIDHLEPDSVYNISLVAVLGGTQSLPVTVEAATRRERENLDLLLTPIFWISGPGNLRVVETTPTSVKVQWEKPQEEIDRYILSVSCCQTDGPDKRQQIKVSPGEDSAVIDDLEPGSVCNISLVAEKSRTQSRPVTLKASTRISGPRNLRVVETTPTSVNVRWEKPQGEIDRYILSVSCCQTDGPDKTWQIKVSSGEDSAVIDDLAPDSVYIISLVAEKSGERSQPVIVKAAPPKLRSVLHRTSSSGYSSVGSSSSGYSSAGCCSSRTSSSESCSTGVSKPRNLRVVKTTRTSVEVQWEKPWGEIDRYILSVSPTQTDGPDKRQQIEVSSGDDSAIINDLALDSVYNISLVAVLGGTQSQTVTVEAATRTHRRKSISPAQNF